MVMPLIANLERAIKNKDKKYIPTDAQAVIIFSQGVSAAAIFMHIGPFKDKLLIMIAISSMLLAGLAFSLKYFWLYNKQWRILEPTNIPWWKSRNTAKEILFVGPSAVLLIYTVLNLGSIYLTLYKIPTPERLTNYEHIKSRIEEDYGKDEEYNIRYVHRNH